MERTSLFRVWFPVLLCAVCLSLPAFSKDQKQTGYISTRSTDGGARIVFNWNSRSKVSFKPETKGNKVYLNFDAPVSLQWGEALADLKPYLKEVETRDDGKTVVLTLDSASKAKKFLVSDRGGYDLSKNGLELTETGSEKQPVSIMPSIDKAASDEARPKKTAKRAAKTKKESRKLAARKPDVVAEAAPKAEIASDESALAQLSPAAGHTEATEAAVAPPATTPPTETPAVAMPAPPAEATPPPAEAPHEAAAEPAPAAVTTKAAEHEKAEKEETIVLPLLADDSFAVFVKNKTLWIAADEGAKLTEESLKAANKSLTYKIQTIPAKQGTVLAIEFDKKTNAEVTKQEDGKLAITLKPGADTPAKVFAPTLATQDNKTSLTIAAAKAGKVISASDPATAEALYIVPVPTFGTGVAAPRSFVEFSLLPTAQGIAVQQVADNLSVQLTKDVLEISSPKGLAVSDEIKHQLEEDAVSAKAGRIPSVFFPYAKWKLDDEKKFVSTQLKLIQDQLSPNAEQAGDARLKLLELYLSEGMFAEANGMSNEILRNSYKFYTEHKISAMRGAANFFRDRFDEAERDFSAPELEGLPETKMWLALCAEMSKKGTGVFKFNENYESFIQYYPPSFIQKLAVIAADKYIAHKEYDSATATFTTLQKEGLDEPIKKYIEFMRAKILSETGNEEEAAKIWERQATDIPDRLIRARAEFSLVNMYLKDEKIPIEDASKRLEKLRIVWRGDELELNVLTLLGNLYVEQKDYAKALRAWRDIVAYYSENQEAISTARKMEAVFVRLYNKGGADDMLPLSALSLFYEFRDLVPTGIEGDLMIRNLAERLVKIDLLDRASQLLSHQIRNRLQGTERSRVGARLAEIYLMNRQPKQALEILKTSGYGELAPELQLERIRLTARALAQQGQLDKAIEVLSSDTSPDGNMLRLSVYWTNWDWPNVVTMAEEILSNRNDPSAPLTLQESEVLLKLATAYVYEHDSGQIQYLHDYFTPLLKNNPNRESFLFITSESGSIDYTNLSNLDTDIKTVKSFIDTSHKQTEGKSASATPTPTATSSEPKKAVN